MGIVNTQILPQNPSKLHVKGKFLFLGEQKFYVKGVTYGTFKPNIEGVHFPEPALIEKDFALMVKHGINTVRTYTVPPISLLDIAQKYKLKVMAGLPWEQHITFLDRADIKTDIVRRIKEGVTQCAQHPAILCYTIGNEIPAPMVRWYGKKRIENFLKQLYHAVKQVDGEALVTYVNYPTTEYLDLGFLDFDCFNVYLETPEKLSKYLARLHNLSGDRPLILAEIGLDSYRNGTEKQAEVLSWQIETVFAKGCAGMFVFAWTDEWWRGGSDIEDWDFGLVDRQRNPKPALFAVSLALDAIPFSNNAASLPHITVIVCSYNGTATIRECMEGVLNLDYPNYDVVVINDGSKDNLAEIVSEYPVKLVTTPNRGLSSARNTGMLNATGEIIAYIDDDAYPDEHWLRYLAYAYSTSDHACIGGPNIVPGNDPFISTCVANAPGGPVHVLETDEIAEHVPGCNMSFRKDALMKIGGFDPVYRCAGDDVDVCWRIQQSGRTIGFHPSAVVWHHRRNSIKAYWKQQKGYGKAEALLEQKWPEKYNSLGHLSWGGRIYGNGSLLPVKVKEDQIFYGSWGSALFQSVYQPAGSFINSIPLMPEWYLISAMLLVAGCLGFLWSPLLWLLPIFAVTILVVLVQAFISTKKNTALQPRQMKSVKYISCIILLHLLQPMARLYGRFNHGLTPWRKKGAAVQLRFLFNLRPRAFAHWSELWHSIEDRLSGIEKKLTQLRSRVKRGGDFDQWDIQVSNGLFARSRGLLTIEEHGGGKQMLRFKCRAGFSATAIFITVLLAGISLYAVLDNNYLVAGIFCFFLAMVVSWGLYEACTTLSSMYIALMAADNETIDEVIQTEKIINKSTKYIRSIQQLTRRNSVKQVKEEMEV